MSKFFGVSVSSVLRRLAGVSLVSVVGLGGVAGAQNVPTLVPYTTKLIAGGGAANTAAGGTCTSGLKSTDAYGDGCLATEIVLVSPRYATADKNGNVFFSDYTNGLVRRVDALTGVVTAVAGGATASPASGATCGAFTSTDARGDGCLGTAVKLSEPVGLAFAPNGDLYFADNGYDNVRKIAATGGVITTTGVITNIAGNVSTYGYNVNNTAASGSVMAATQSYLNFPYGLSFDAAGNLYIADEGNNALEVVNLTSATETLQGLTVPAGTIAKFAGYGSLGAKTPASGDCPDFVSTSSRGGCYFGSWKDGSLANVSNIDGGYSVAVDKAGNVFFANEFNYNIGLITPANVISDYAGIQGTSGKTIARGPASTTGVGSLFGVTVDAVDNVYFTDASSALIWRVDAGTKAMYPVAGGAKTVCSGGDSRGNGCPALQSTFGTTVVTGGNASTKAPGPGIFGVSVDASSNLYVGDTVTNEVREVASNSSFGVVGANQPTQTLEVHFAVGDGPAASNPYVLTAGAGNFTLGTQSCTTNSDNTMDCLLPVTATPTTLGAFTGTLTVTSTQGATNAFTLSGTYAQSPATRTVVTFSAPSVTCTGTTTYSTTTPIAITATITANGPAAPGGTVQFYANGAPIGTPQSVAAGGTSSVPVYTASLTYTFSTPNTYTLTAVYSGDSYFMTSTSTGTNVTSSNPTFAASAISYQESSVVAGGTALYSFNVAQNVYAGTITFACSGLPANAACSFSPSTVTANGCSTGTTVALSITTAQGNVTTSGFGGFGNGRWQLVAMFPAVGLALLIGLRRRKAGMRYGQIWMGLALLIGLSSLMACTGSKLNAPLTPSGTSTVTVTATGSAGTTSSFTVPLTVK